MDNPDSVKDTVERVARAIFTVHHEGPPLQGDPVEDYVPAARAAIAALTTPADGLGEELERRARGATAGPWSYEPDREGSSMGWIGHEITAGRGQVFRALFDITGDSAEQAVNAELIVALRNNLPAIITALRAAQPTERAGVELAYERDRNQASRQHHKAKRAEAEALVEKLRADLDAANEQIRALTAPTDTPTCPSCHGLNTSCPDGCGRDPATGELNGTRLDTPATASRDAEMEGIMRRAAIDGSKHEYDLATPPEPSGQSVGEWQDIATFAEPTTLSRGNGVLVACADGTVGEAYFRNFGDESDGWWWANTSWGDYPEPDRPTPTHWQPLPKPPHQETDNG